MATVPNDFRRRLLSNSRNLDLEQLRVRRFNCSLSESDSIAIVAKLVQRVQGKFLEESFRTNVNETGKITSFNTKQTNALR